MVMAHSQYFTIETTRLSDRPQKPVLGCLISSVSQQRSPYESSSDTGRAALRSSFHRLFARAWDSNFLAHVWHVLAEGAIDCPRKETRTMVDRSGPGHVSGSSICVLLRHLILVYKSMQSLVGIHRSQYVSRS